MTCSDGSIEQEGLTHAYYWQFQNNRMKTIRRDVDRIIRRIARRKRSGPLLEIGTGMGHALKLLGDSFSDEQIFGIDNDSIMLRYAGRLLSGSKNVDLICADCRGRLPFQSESFSAVISEHTFHHLNDIDATLHETFRLLKKGGVFVLVDLEPRRLQSRLFRLVYALLLRLGVNWPLGKAVDISLVRAQGGDGMINRVCDAGLHVVDVAGYRMNYVITALKLSDEDAIPPNPDRRKPWPKEDQNDVP